MQGNEFKNMMKYVGYLRFVMSLSPVKPFHSPYFKTRSHTPMQMLKHLLQAYVLKTILLFQVRTIYSLFKSRFDAIDAFY